MAQTAMRKEGDAWNFSYLPCIRPNAGGQLLPKAEA
jgi:hypothetical protein